MAVDLSMDINSPELGKGHVRITAEGIPNDLFVPLALSALGKDDDRMMRLFQAVLSNADHYEEDGDESEDEDR